MPPRMALIPIGLLCLFLSVSCVRDTQSGKLEFRPWAWMTSTGQDLQDLSKDVPAGWPQYAMWGLGTVLTIVGSGWGTKKTYEKLKNSPEGKLFGPSNKARDRRRPSTPTSSALAIDASALEETPKSIATAPPATSASGDQESPCEADTRPPA